MARPHQPDVPYPVDDAEEPPITKTPLVGRPSEQVRPRVLRLRVAAWDVCCTLAMVALLIILATVTTWPARLFGFLHDECVVETCGPVPFGVDYYIRPIVWGGIGAAIASSVVGPIVSLLKGWYMSFWPVLSLALVMVASVIGSILTTFSARFWL
ncbi:MAG: hypothetical protein ACXVX1_04920 [Mycobacterium sp.]